MAIYSSPTLKMIFFEKKGIHAGQVQISHKKTGELDTISRSAHLWEGVTGWFVGDDIDRKRVTNFIKEIQGPVNQILIPLPSEYSPENPVPTALELTVDSVTRNSDGTVTVTYAETGATWAPSADDHINIGHRSYVITETDTSNNTIKIYPNLEPSTGLVIYTDPFIIATITNYEELRASRSGYRYENLMVRWREHPFYTDRGGVVVPVTVITTEAGIIITTETGEALAA